MKHDRLKKPTRTFRRNIKHYMQIPLAHDSPAQWPKISNKCSKEVEYRTHAKLEQMAVQVSGLVIANILTIKLHRQIANPKPMKPMIDIKQQPPLSHSVNLKLRNQARPTGNPNKNLRQTSCITCE